MDATAPSIQSATSTLVLNMDNTDSHSQTRDGKPAASPLFVFGNQIIPKARRGWERAPRSPRKTHGKGAKVWRRLAPPSQETDDLASAQLMGDLAAATTGPAVKRQRVQHMPAIPAQMQKKPTYAPTLIDSGALPKRKIAKRRRSVKSPVKLQQDALTVPASSTRRRRSSVRKASPTKTLDLEAPGESSLQSVTENAAQGPERFTNEPSFLETVSLSASTMFDKDAEDQDSEHSGIYSDEDASALDIELTDDGSDDSDNEPSDAVDEGVYSTARLLDAGNTGVVTMPDQDGASFEEDVDDGSINDNGGLDLQENVTGLLSTPLKDQRPNDDEKSASPSPATNDEALKVPALGLAPIDASPTALLQREETGSTVEFDESFYKSTVMQVTKDDVFQSPKRTNIAQAQALSSPEQLVEHGANDSDVQEAASNLSRDNEEKRTSSVQEVSGNGAEAETSTAQEQQSIEDISDEESEDELFAGEPTINNIVLSPLKQAAASPTRSPIPRKTRSAPRLSDDTTYLTDFLSRVKAQEAAKSQAVTASPVKASLPKTSPRQALAPLDANSPSPSPVKRRTSTENGSPVKIPRTPTAKILLENTLSPDTPDELGAPAEEAEGPRRSVRPRMTVPTKPNPTAPNAIPFRRADGEPFLLQRSDAQKLAMATRANTRRNKGAAMMPRSVLETLENKDLSPIKQKEPGRNKKGQNVDWDNTLVYYLGDKKTRSKRKAKEITEDPVEDKENTEPAADTPLPKKRTVKIARTPRVVKTPSTNVEEVKEPKEKEEVKPAAVEKTPAAVEKKTPVSRLRKPRASGIPTRNTPAPKKQAASVQAAPSSMPAPRRTARRV